MTILSVRKVAESNRRKPRTVHGHVLDLLSFHAELEFLEQYGQLFAVDQVDCWCAVTRRLTHRFRSEVTSRHHQPLICASDHRTSKIPNGGRSNRVAPSFALKDNVKRQNLLELEEADSVNALFRPYSVYSNAYHSLLGEDPRKYAF